MKLARWEEDGLSIDLRLSLSPPTVDFRWGDYLELAMDNNSPWRCENKVLQLAACHSSFSLSGSVFGSVVEFVSGFVF